MLFLVSAYIRTLPLALSLPFVHVRVFASTFALALIIGFIFIIENKYILECLRYFFSQLIPGFS